MTPSGANGQKPTLADVATPQTRRARTEALFPQRGNRYIQPERSGVMETGDIIFWVISVTIAALAGAWLLRSAARPTQGPGTAPDLAVYRAQLAELDRDIARATVSPDEAERLRAEIGRRLLAADRLRAASGTATQGPAFVTALVGIALAAAFGLYAWLGAPGYPDVPHARRIAEAENLRANRPSQAEALAEQPTPPLADPEDPEMASLIRQLRQAVAARPDDLRGLELLAGNEAALGNSAAAADAQARVVALKGEAATATDHAVLADALILAAHGYVSPEAEAAILAALGLDPRNGTAQFYLGLLEAQTGRPDRAFSIWRALFEASPPEAPWVPVIRERLPMLAEAAGVDYSLPPEASGPGAADVAAAQDMAPQDRDAMIRGMVDQLAARIDSQGGRPDEWARLITSLAVLGEAARAADAWARAQDHFAADPGGLGTVAAAARKAGLAE
jgi:cytochrome c-type biogenesis protein CcmH